MRIPKEFRAILVFLFFAVWFLSGNALAAQTIADPVYIAISNGWIGLYGHGDEYAKFPMRGKEVKLQDAYHIILKPGLGMMVSFADKAEFGGGANLLENHTKWELDYWKSKADRAEAVTRKDLSGTREDIRVTEIKLYRNDGAQLHIFMIALASKDGVFVLAVSPGSSETDATVREIANSFTLVHRTLSTEEIARASKAIKGRIEE